MSIIVIQKEISSLIQDVVAKGSALTWNEFVDQVAGDHDALCRYTNLIKIVPSMDTPDELMVQFTMLRGLFASSEAKMMALLEDAGFTPEVDYYLLDVTNESYAQSLLFISYNCIKMFVLANNNVEASRALHVGEHIYAQYNHYQDVLKAKPVVLEVKKEGKPAKAVITRTVSPSTHYYIVEQRKFTEAYKGQIERWAKDMHKPEVVMVCISGTKLNMKKKLDAMATEGDKWGDIIVPLTKAIYADAKDDLGRIMRHVTEVLIAPYKAAERLNIAEANKNRKEGEPKIKVPVQMAVWGVMAQAKCAMIDPTNTKVPFTYQDMVQCIREFYTNTLAQRHVSIDGLDNSQYLQLVEDLQQERIERSGLFSAIRANAIYSNEMENAKKLIAKAERAAEKAKNGGKAKKSESAPASVPRSRQAPKAVNGFETGGSDDEPTPAPEESEVEDKPAPTTSVPNETNEQSDTETKPAPTTTRKRSAKKEESKLDEKPAPTTRKRPTKKEESDSEDKPAPTTTRKRSAKKEESDSEDKPAPTTTRKRPTKKEESKVDDKPAPTTRKRSTRIEIKEEPKVEEKPAAKKDTPTPTGYETDDGADLPDDIVDSDSEVQIISESETEPVVSDSDGDEA